MIIDTILDLKDFKQKKASFENLKYIYDEAEIFGFDDIKKAISEFDGKEKLYLVNCETDNLISLKNRNIQKALINYIMDNNYNLEIIKYVLNIKWVNKENYGELKSWIDEKFIKENENLFFVNK